LVADAALSLQERGHKVEIFTAHHNPPHAFEETMDGACACETGERERESDKGRRGWEIYEFHELDMKM
jgi:hypothetical protein